MKNFFKLFLPFFFAWQISASAAPMDSTNLATETIVVRHFDQKKFEKLKNGREFDYKIEKPKDLGFWAKLENLISNYLSWIFGKIFMNAPNASRWILISVFGVLLAFIIIKLLDINIKDSLFSKGDKGNLNYSVEEENIHDLDFNKLIDDSVQRGDYRVAIRYLYLFSLKKLSDRHLIDWIPGKTNHEYELEIKEKNIGNYFSKLGYYFEYTWYGEFNVSSENFLKVQHIFQNLDESIAR